MSDSDNRQPKSTWPAVERRSGADRRVERPNSATRISANDVVEVRTPRPGRRDERRSGQDRRDDSAWKSVPLEITLATEADLAEALVAAATLARTRAQARYSGFKVGAALETANGVIITGCNIENATYGLTICAERVAMFKALSEGHRKFTRIAVVADTVAPTPPCGACRQILWEFGGDLEVILANLRRETGRHQLKDLLPLPFDARLLS